MSQTVTVLRELRAAGSVGVHSFYLRRQKFIGNPSARIMELEEMGHGITSEPEKLHGSAVGRRYTLVRDAGGSGDRNEWLLSQGRVVETPADAVPAITRRPAAEPVAQSHAEPVLIEGELGLCLFDSSSDTTSDHYRAEAAA